MKNFVLDIDKNHISEKSIERFLSISGIANLDPDVKEEMLDIASDVINKTESSLKIKAIISVYDNNSITGEAANLDNVSLFCKAFSQVAGDDIVKIYVYIISLDFETLISESPFDSFYSDTLATAYIDCARDYLQTYIQKLNRENLFMSNSFGPGYYGMALSEMDKIFKIMKGDLIGATINSSGVITPRKSCAGLYFSLRNEFQLKKDVCINCIGNVLSCNYCTFNL